MTPVSITVFFYGAWQKGEERAKKNKAATTQAILYCLRPVLGKSTHVLFPFGIEETAEQKYEVQVLYLNISI